MQKTEKLITIHALHNAIKFSGKATAGAIIGKMLQEQPALKKDMKGLAKKVHDITKKINKLTLAQQQTQLKKLKPSMLKKKKTKKRKQELPAFTNTKNVVMRFAPSPSGPMHIGHAYALALNSTYAKKYKGKLILRIEDTNPDNIYEPAYSMLPHEGRWLTNNNIDKVIIQSDRLKLYYKYAEQVIKLGKAYVCTCTQETFKKKRNAKKACPCRNLSPNENIIRWKKMFTTYTPGQAVVRIKTDMQHKNPALRDWPAFRINTTTHPRTGMQYRIWPLMNFSVTIDDIETKITHIIRAKDHADNAQKQAYLYTHLRKKPPKTMFVGRINFEELAISTSQTRQKIEDKKYTGWDDIRLPFIAALQRRGYQAQAFTTYALAIGISKNDKKVTGKDYFTTLNAFNKDIIDKKANRYFFIEHPQKITISNAPQQTIHINKHPDYPKRGKRTFATEKEYYVSKHDLHNLQQGKLYRLMDCLNFKKTKNDYVFASQEYQAYKNKGTMIMHWLPVSKKLVHVEVMMPDASTIKGLGETSMNTLKPGDEIQLERFGFCKVDKLKKEKVFLWFTHT
jgi:glutamyl-tRNA synthetase